MGNNQSEFDKNKDLSPRDKERMLQQNLLQQERIKNQVLQGKLENTQEILNSFRGSQVLPMKSSNPLLTNPELQKEFMRNKKMQEELLKIIMKQKSLNLNDSQYDKINDFLKKLNIEENEDDMKKTHLFINQGTRKVEQNTNYMKVNEEKKPEIGVSASERDKLIRLIKKQKLEEIENNKREHEKRKKEYESKLQNFQQNDINPYKILDVSKTASMNEIKTAYKRKAKIYHPDRPNGNKEQFQLITMAFMLLIEKYKKTMEDKQFTTLKDESRKELEKQKNVGRRNVNMKGDRFNNKLFNKIYDENKLYNPNDEGYGNWMRDNEYDSDKIPKVFSNDFNLNVFNSTFNERKTSNSQEIINYSQPKALSLVRGNFEELGGGAVGDYSSTNNKMNYADYKKAHTETTLINPDNVRVKNYNSVKDLEFERSKKQFLSERELQQIAIQEAKEKELEEVRLRRLNEYDDKSFRQFERINKIFLK